MFRIGQKVVCIEDGELPNATGVWDADERLFKGNIYTITGIMQDYSFPDQLIVTLFEVKRNEVSGSLGMFGYAIERFRPLVEKSTDISSFKALLNSNKILEPA